MNLIIPEDNEETALTINEKKRNLHHNDFMKYAVTAGLTKEVSGRLMEQIVSKQSVYIDGDRLRTLHL